MVALHRLLWINQEKIGDYLSSSRDHKAVGRRPFDKMAMLLAYLGPPEHRPLDSQSVTYLFDLLNGSPVATKIVVVVVWTYCYQIFNSLKLSHFTTDRNYTSATDW